MAIESPVAGWTPAKWKGWVIALLRRGTLRFPNRNEVLNESKTKKKINKLTGRMAQHYKCAGCKKDFPLSKVAVDHIEPVVDPAVGFVSWDEYITRMFCTKDKLQVLCNGFDGSCHDLKTKGEKECRKSGKIFQDTKDTKLLH